MDWCWCSTINSLKGLITTSTSNSFKGCYPNSNTIRIRRNYVVQPEPYFSIVGASF